MKKVIFSVALFTVTLTLSGCSVLPSQEKAPEPSPVETISEAKSSIAVDATVTPTPSQSASPSTARTEVIWADYDPGTQGEIDRMTNAGDCLGINSYFGMTTATEESVKARTGHGNEAITKYLNEALALAKCN